MTKFRSGKRKDGSKYSFPLTESGREARPPKVTIINLKKQTGWSRFSEQDLIDERDLLPNVNPDSDYGWLSLMEEGYNEDHNDRDQARIMKMLDIAKNGTLAESAVALTALETEFPKVLRHYENQKTERKAGLIARLKASQAKKGERLSDQPIKEVFAGTARDIKERAGRARESKDPIGEFFSKQKKQVAEFKEAKEAKETLKEKLADTETERLGKEAQTKWVAHEKKVFKEMDKPPRDESGQFKKKEE